MGPCDCAHRWRWAGHDVEHGISGSSYRCEVCRKRLTRDEDMGLFAGVPFLYCDAGSGPSVCTWPSCVAVPRPWMHRIGHRIRAILWAIDAYSDPA